LLYAAGVFSSRKLERASYDSVAFRYIAAGSHPDHDTLASFRRRFLHELSALFVQVLEMAREMPEGATAMQAMAHRLKTKAGRALYALRQADGRAGVRHHQISDGVSPVLHARPEQGQRGVELGMPGLECEAHGRIASEIRVRGEKPRGNHKNSSISTRFCLFFKQLERSTPISIPVSDRLLGQHVGSR
jgi:hypothetical protein